MDHRANVKQLQVLESSKLKSTMKSRKAELAITKLMRDQFEKNEKIALRSSKVYQNVHRQKKLQIHLAAERAAKGAGDMYVDSDRRIAVGMGAEDLKGQVEKYKDEMSCATGKLSEIDIEMIHILMEQSKYDLHNNKPQAALTYVERALRLDNTLVEVLELKCQCYLKMNKYQEASDAADMILYELREYHNPKALAVKAEAMYNMGNFEHALVNFYRSLKRSTVREKEILYQNIKRTELAVLNAVGPQVSHYFKSLDKILVHITKTNILGMPWHKVKNIVATKETKTGSKFKDRKFLSQLATDKHYLEGLAKTINKEKSVSNEPQRDNIVNEALDALEFLNGRRDFWSQQNPEYPDEVKVNLKAATPMDVLMTRLRAKQTCQGRIAPSGTSLSALQSKIADHNAATANSFKPFLNYKCRPTVTMRFEYSGSPTKKSSTAVTQVDPRQAKKQARAMIMSHH